MGFKLFLLFEKFLMILPRQIRKYFFICLSVVAYMLSARYRSAGFANLDFAFDGKMSKKEKKSIIKYSFRNLLLNFYYLLEIRKMSADDLKKIIKMQNLEVVQNIHDQNRAIVFVTPHYGAWELSGISIGSATKPMLVVYRKMKNPNYNRWVLETRQKFGNTLAEKTNVVKQLLKAVKNTQDIIIAIDTNLNKREGTQVEFFGKSVRQTTTPAYLARKYNAAIVPFVIKTDDENSYTITFFDEIAVEKTDDEDADIQKATQLQADWLTKVITEEPKFWFWIHRRWKNDHPEIYL